jgi:hypothetical protein
LGKSTGFVATITRIAPDNFDAFNAWMIAVTTPASAPGQTHTPRTLQIEADQGRGLDTGACSSFGADIGASIIAAANLGL